MLNRTDRARLAAETDNIVIARGYDAATWVDLGETLERAQHGTHLHAPGDELLNSATAPTDRAGRIEVTAESTLEATARLSREGADVIACLNFASAKHPGGGYRGGSQAQEESLARSSGLVSCLEAVSGFYDVHQRQHDPVYSDRVVCSPAVPVFRTDDGNLLDRPYPVTFLTCAAPNAGALRDRGRHEDLQRVLVSRARRVLSAAVLHGHSRIVLGAWGCGVFRNDPAVVAAAFAELLRVEFGRAFDLVTFAVFDQMPGAPVLDAFRTTLES